MRLEWSGLCASSGWLGVGIPSRGGGDSARGKGGVGERVDGSGGVVECVSPSCAVLRGDTEKLFGQKSRQSKTPLETSRFSRRKKNRMARGVSPPRHPICCSHVRTASTYKLAIARDDSVNHVLPIPLSVE